MMEFFHFIELKVLFLFAQLFKIQSNWFLEGMTIMVSMLIITFVMILNVKLFKKKREQVDTGFRKWGKNLFFYVITLLNLSLIFSFVVHIALIAYMVNANFDLEDVSYDPQKLQQELSNIDIYDQNGNKVYTVVNNGVNRESISINEMPEHLQDAFVDVEDKDFYEHSGVSVIGYVRAIYRKILHPSESMNGGSTITQQLIKNVNGDMYNRTVLNKYQEAMLSIIIENKYSKKQILEMYLNRIYLGSGNVYGVSSASKEYFNKNVSDLSLAESAYLAGLPQAPSSYTDNLELGNKRKNIVLHAMKVNGTITENQYQKAVQETISFTDSAKKQTAAFDAYIDYVLKEAKKEYKLTDADLKNNGYRIYTYLDSNLQTNMYNTAESFTYRDDQKGNGQKVQVGIAAVDNNNEKIIALYGGRDYKRGYLNRANNYYQPGSIIKPLAVYTPAFETKEWGPYSKVLDQKRDFGGYSPKNAEPEYEGYITVERALIRSANVPAVSVLQDIGVDKGVASLKKMDIEVKKKDEQLHLALGGMEKGVTPIQMAQAYAVFPNYGYFQPAKAIKYIKDKHDDYVVAKENTSTKGVDVFKPVNAYHMTEILQKVISDPSGTGKNANIGRPVAGKTGTAEEVGTSGNRASWFVGYTPDITMSVHLGFDNPSAQAYLTTYGGDEPARIFSSIMKKSLEGTPVREFQKPNGVRSISDKTSLTKTKNVQAKFVSSTKAVHISWDRGDYSSGISYNVYKKVKKGNDVLVGSTTESSFDDSNLQQKEPLDEVPSDGSFLEKFTHIVQNIITFVKNTLPHRETYYVVATYQNEQAPASDSDAAWIPRVSATVKE